MYYFVNWKRTDEGFVADLPEGMSYLVLAEPSEYGTYGVFRVDVFSDEAPALQIQAVPEELADLLASAEQYPPALALARDKVRKVSGAERALFAETLASCLRDRLLSQITSPYFLAAAKWTETGYKSAGAFYWIVGYRPDRPGHEVGWVSRDFFVYSDPMADFDLDVALLEARFPPKPG